VHPYRHGTTVAEIIAGQDNGWGQTGVWPHAKIVSVRAFASSGLPGYGHYARAVARCLEYRVSRTARVRVINLSLGQLSGSDDERLLLAEQIAAAHERDVSVVAAVGNRGRIEFPATEPGVLAVTAADSTGGTCSFSAAGSGTVTAAGCRVLSAGADGTPTAVTGTSFAAPAVSAVLAAIRAYRPDWPRERAEHAIRTAAASGGSGQATLLDAEALFGAADLPSMWRPPTLAGAPSIAGSGPEPGTLLTCIAGIWNADRSRDYSWQRSDRTIAAGREYVVTAADVGASLTCAEVAHNRAGSTVGTSPRVLVPVTTARRAVQGQPVVPLQVPVPRRLTVRTHGGVVVVRFSRSSARHVVEAVLGKLRARGRGPELRLRRALNARVVRVWSIDRRTGRRSAPISVTLPPANGVLRARARWRSFP
jgi:subtilisin family serine protease